MEYFYLLGVKASTALEFFLDLGNFGIDLGFKKIVEQFWEFYTRRKFLKCL